MVRQLLDCGCPLSPLPLSGGARLDWLDLSGEAAKLPTVEPAPVCCYTYPVTIYEPTIIPHG
jgi:hypothetical protein